MDGTLLDAEGPAQLAFARAIEDMGFVFDSAAYARCLGTTFAETQVILLDVYGEELDMPAPWAMHGQLTLQPPASIHP